MEKEHLTPFGKAMALLGIEMIPTYSPEARGALRAPVPHSPRAAARELAAVGITDRAGAHRYLAEVYRPTFNAEFMQPALAEGSAFVPWSSGDLNHCPCEVYERVVGKDNCVAFEGMALQIPKDRHRMHGVRVQVRVHRWPDGQLALFHGPRCLAQYAARGHVIPPSWEAVASGCRAAARRCANPSGQFMCY